MTEPFPEERRRQVFAALVAAQDDGLSVSASREKVAAEQGINTDQLQQIEKEGLKFQWPPLDA